jgi:ribosome-binding protein aMBF1 (putative translation factor)
VKGVVNVKQPSPAELSKGFPANPVDDANAEVARLVALELQAAIDEHGLRPLAAKIGMHHRTLLATAAGEVWPNARLIAGLERALGRTVWPEYGEGTRAEPAGA